MKHELEFRDLVYDVVYSAIRSKDPCRRLNGVSGKMRSGEIYFVISDHSESKDAFVNLLSGRVPKNDNTYGIVTYNGRDRVWSDWSRQFRVLDLNHALRNYTFTEYMEREVRFHFPFLDSEERKAKLIELTDKLELTIGVSLDISNFDIVLVILHLLLTPDMLVINNFFSDEIVNYLDFIKSLLSHFVKENESILIVADCIDLKDCFKSCWASGILILNSVLIYQGRLEDFHNEMSVIATGNPLKDVTIRPDLLNKAFNKIRNENMKKASKLPLDKIVSINNIDVSIDTVKMADILRICKQRLKAYFTRYLGYAWLLILLLYGVNLLIYKSDFPEVEDILSDVKTCTSKDAFYVAATFYLEYFIILVPIFSLIANPELSINLDYSEEFVMGTVSPYTFLIAKFLTFNLVIYPLNALLILISFRKYFNLLTASYSILLSFVFGFIFNVMYFFFHSSFSNPLVSLLCMTAYAVFSGKCDLSTAAYEFNTCGRFTLAYLVYIDPFFISGVILEVACLRHALTSNRSHFYREFYLHMRKSTMKALNGFRDDPCYKALLDYDFEPEAIYSTIRLPPNNCKIYLLVGILILTFIQLSFYFGKRSLVPNIRLKLRN